MTDAGDLAHPGQPGQRAGEGHDEEDRALGRHAGVEGGARVLAHDADLVAPEGVARVNANTDDVAGRNGRGVQWFERLVRDHRIPIVAGRRVRQHVQPPRSDDADPE